MKNETSDNDAVTVRTQSNTPEKPAPSSQFPDATKSVNLESDDAPDVQQQQPYGKLPGSKKKLFIALAVGIAIIGAGIAAVYFLLLQQPAQTEKDTDPLTAATRFDNPQALINAVEPDLKGIVMEVQSTSGVSAADSDGIYAYGAPVYKPADAKYSVMPLEMTGSAYKGNSTVAEKNYAALKNFFEQNKFVKKNAASNAPGTASDTSENVNYVAYAEYESSNMLCMIRHADATPTKAQAHIVGVGCADKQSYSQAVSKLQPFYTAYTSSGDIFSDKLVFGFIDEADGASGYKYARIYQEDEKQFDSTEEMKPLTALYYQTPSKPEWTYFTINTVNSLPICTAYNSETLKNAFKGYECFDEATQKYAKV